MTHYTGSRIHLTPYLIYIGEISFTQRLENFIKSSCKLLLHTSDPVYIYLTHITMYVHMVHTSVNESFNKSLLDDKQKFNLAIYYLTPLSSSVWVSLVPPFLINIITTRYDCYVHCKHIVYIVDMLCTPPTPITCTENCSYEYYKYFQHFLAYAPNMSS